MNHVSPRFGNPLRFNSLSTRTVGWIRNGPSHRLKAATQTIVMLRSVVPRRAAYSSVERSPRHKMPIFQTFAATRSGNDASLLASFHGPVMRTRPSRHCKYHRQAKIAKGRLKMRVPKRLLWSASRSVALLSSYRPALTKTEALASVLPAPGYCHHCYRL
jgi:hypothetical protein